MVSSGSKGPAAALNPVGPPPPPLPLRPVPLQAEGCSAQLLLLLTCCRRRSRPCARRAPTTCRCTASRTRAWGGGVIIYTDTHTMTAAAGSWHSGLRAVRAPTESPGCRTAPQAMPSTLRSRGSGTCMHARLCVCVVRGGGGEVSVCAYLHWLQVMCMQPWFFSMGLWHLGQGLVLARIQLRFSDSALFLVIHLRTVPHATWGGGGRGCGGQGVRG